MGDIDIYAYIYVYIQQRDLGKRAQKGSGNEELSWSH